MKQKQIKTLNDTEITKLIAGLINQITASRQSVRRYRDLLMILLMLDAGLRVGEVVQLKINDLYWGENPVSSVLIRAEISKNKSERWIPTSDRLIETLKAMQLNVWLPGGKSETDFAFSLSKNGKHISVRQVERIISIYGEKLLNRKLHPHILRHTFATRLMKKTNIRVVQKLLGHASISTTQIYTHPSEEDFRNAINDINQ